jgi:hypothetical protein
LREEPGIGLQQLHCRTGRSSATHDFIVADKITDSQTIANSDANRRSDSNPDSLALPIAGAHSHLNRHADRETIGLPIAGTYPNRHPDADSSADFNLSADQRADCHRNDGAFGESVRVGSTLSRERSSTPLDHPK